MPPRCQSQHRLAAVHYVLGMGLLVAYGAQVCPFIETLPVLVWASLLVVSYALLYVARLPLERRLLAATPPALKARRLFWLDFGLFASGGLVLAGANMILFGFPVESGLKVALGTTTLGYFLALDTALCAERSALACGEFSAGPYVSALPFASMPRKFAMAATAGIILYSSVLMLVVFKDIRLLEDESLRVDIAELLMGVGLEIAFVLLVLMALTHRVIWSYSRNLRHLFALQTGVLEDVGRGVLHNLVPVVTDDEFGAVAEYTNRMIEGLREKQRIRDVLGKVVDPLVADRLLAAKGVDLGGTRSELAILMSDVRGFTSRSESIEPEHLVGDLNTYFTRMVQVVQEGGGVVDKFIGDGLLAVFGLDDPSGACDAAVRAALQMQEALAEINPSLRSPMRIGVGVHRGPVISGLVGSPERLEFTVIGDAVNTASRLESLTKQVDAPVVVSATVYDDIAPELQALFRDLGEHPLKGKAAPVRVYGAGTRDND